MAETPLSTLETLIRYILGDYLKNMIPGDIFTCENSTVFTLTEPNAKDLLEVFKNDIALTSGQYSFDYLSNKVTVPGALSGDIIEMQYTYYPNYSSTEIQAYVHSALVYLSVHNYYTWQIEDSKVYPDPDPNEVNLIALVTSTLIYPDNKSYSLPDIRITSPKDLPLSDKIHKLIAIAKWNTHGAFELL